MRSLPSRAVWLLVIVIGVGSCGFPTEQHAAPIAPGDLPAALVADTAEGPDEPSSVAATVWLVNGDRLEPVSHRVAAPASPESVTADLLGGATPAEQSRGLRSALPAETVVDGVAYERGAVTVSLSTTFADIPATDQLLAVGQLVLTLTDIPGVGTVTFVVAGDPVAVPLPTGETSNQPLYRQQYVALRAGSPAG